MRILRAVAAATLALVALAPAAVGAAGDVPVRLPDQAVYDVAGAFSADTEETAESLLRAIRASSGSDVVVVSEDVPETASQAAANARATVLRVALGVGTETATTASSCISA